MATPTKPVTTEPTGTLFRALRSVNVEPNLAYDAAEENRRMAGENVVAVIGAQITELKAKIDAQVPGWRLKSKPKPRASTFYSV